MTYDPNRTTVLPSTQTGFPITEDLPVVRIREQRPWVRNLGLVLLVITIAVGFAFAANVIRDRTSTTATEVEVTPTVVEALPPAAPTVVTETTTAEPGFWQVVGVADGLNVRSGPGIENDIVGTLLAGQRHVFATGQRSNNAGEWMQIAIDDTDQVGWVSARFLAADTAPPQGQPRATVAPVTGSSTSTVCFASSTEPPRVARLAFTDRVEISGQLVTQLTDSELRQNVSGALENGEAVVTLTDSQADTIVRRRWIFNPATVELGDGTTMRVVDCATISLN